jgi:hypothetical protein
MYNLLSINLTIKLQLPPGSLLVYILLFIAEGSLKAGIKSSKSPTLVK